MAKTKQLDISEADLYDGDPAGFDIYSWSPTPQADVAAGKPQAPSTQVHLYISLPPPFGRAMFRFKGPGTLDRLIAGLIKHRCDVWGTPTDMKVWMVE